MTPPLRYFTRAELLTSQRAIMLGLTNEPPPELNTALSVTLAGCERVRAFLGHPMRISSGYRCPELNKAVGGAADSQHMKAEAIDFVCPAFGDPQAVARAINRARFVLGIDQVILEPSWVHLSFTLEPRYDALTFMGGRYQAGIT